MKLADYLKLNDIKPSHFAASIGVSPQTVSGWIDGNFWISRDRAEAVYRETKGAVTPTDFLRLEEVSP